ncbi:hypothetical protein ACWCQV_42605, partial [Streptomyces eurythermus]
MLQIRFLALRRDAVAHGRVEVRACVRPAVAEAGGGEVEVWTYWRSPADTIPIGPTTILARTELRGDA